jgi:hypothetical protein
MSETYITIGQPPETRIELLMYDILLSISGKIEAFYNESSVRPGKTTHLEMICMITTNVFVNLLEGATRKDISSQDRLKVMRTCLDEITRISTSLWTALEANLATRDTAH